MRHSKKKAPKREQVDLEHNTGGNPPMQVDVKDNRVSQKAQVHFLGTSKPFVFHCNFITQGKCIRFVGEFHELMNLVLKQKEAMA